MNWTRYKHGIANVFVFILAFFLGIFFHSNIVDNNAVVSLLREKSNYQYISPLLGFDFPEDVGLRQYEKLHKKIESAIADERRNGNIDTASVYIRKLSSGRWISINEEEKFSPASMLKVTVMMAYYKVAESNPGLLQGLTKFVGINDRNANSFYQPSSLMENGKSYSIEDLVERMIKYFDNTAHYMLLHNNIFSPDSLVRIDKDLGVNIRNIEDDTKDFMTTGTYSTFFRVLYNATYLNNDMSEKALGLLAAADFKDGLVAKLPPDIVVAHKFGERSIPLQDNLFQRELHDCGIVYYSEHPYFICVMTSGRDFQKLSLFIANTSKMVFDYINEEYRKYD